MAKTPIGPAQGNPNTPESGQTAASGTAPTPESGQTAASGTAPTPESGQTAASGTAPTPESGQTAASGATLPAGAASGPAGGTAPTPESAAGPAGGASPTPVDAILPADGADAAAKGAAGAGSGSGGGGGGIIAPTADAQGSVIDWQRGSPDYLIDGNAETPSRIRIAEGGPAYVLVGTGRIFRSEDGLTWTELAQQSRLATYIPGAIGDTLVIRDPVAPGDVQLRVSRDRGNTWETKLVTTANKTPVEILCATEDQWFVATTTTLFWTDDGGDTWTFRDYDSGLGLSNFISSIGVVGDTWVVGAGNQEMATTTNAGLTWTAFTNTNHNGLTPYPWERIVTTASGRFFARTHYSGHSISDDGLNWSAVPTPYNPTVTGPLYGIAANGNELLIAGTELDQGYKSNNYGASWESTPGLTHQVDIMDSGGVGVIAIAFAGPWSYAALGAAPLNRDALAPKGVAPGSTLSPLAGPSPGPEYPRIGYLSIFKPGDSAVSDDGNTNQAPNVLTPTTWDRFIAAGSSATVTLITTSPSTVNYVALAGLNLPDTNGTVTVEVAATPGGSRTTVGSSAASTRSTARLFEFTPQTVAEVRVTITSSTGVKPTLAVVQCGAVLVMERPVYSGVSPSSLASRTVRQPKLSDSGQYLGGRVIRKAAPFNASFRHLSDSWYRDFFDPVVIHAQSRPFFVAWNPVEDPEGVLYGWSVGDIVPTKMGILDLMEVELEMTGHR